MYVHVPLKTLQPIVPMDNTAHQGPLQNINPPTHCTNVTQDPTMDGVLVLEILAWRGIEPSTTTRVGTLLQFNQQPPSPLDMPLPPHHTMCVCFPYLSPAAARNILSTHQCTPLQYLPVLAFW